MENDIINCQMNPVILTKIRLKKLDVKLSYNICKQKIKISI